MNGVAPGATVLPIRVAGWQPEASGRWAVYGRTDQLIAGLERAVDPNLDGVALDAARDRARRGRRAVRSLRGQPVGQSRGGSAPARHARRRAGRQRRSGRARGTEASRARADPVRRSPSARPTSGTPLRPCASWLRVGLGVLFDRRVPLAGAVEPSSDQTLSLSVPRLGPAELDAGRAAEPRRVLLEERPEPRRGPRCARPCGQRSRATQRRRPRRRAPASVVLYGDALPGGGHRPRRRRHRPGRRAAVRARQAARRRARRGTDSGGVDRSNERRDERHARAASRRSRPAGSRSTGS